MQFTEKEIQLLVTLLESERVKEQHTLNFFHAEIESAYKKLIDLLKKARKDHRSKGNTYCDRCQCATPESELDNNDGLCNPCSLIEYNMP